MGSGASAAASSTTQANKKPEVSKSHTYWIRQVNIVEAKNRYVADGSIKATCTEEELEFRVLLDEPLAFTSLKLFASRQIDQTWHNHLMEWKKLTQNKRKLSLSFYDLSAAITQLGSDNNDHTSQLSQELSACFDKLFTNMFEIYQKSGEYALLCEALNKRNSVVPSDFDYFSVVGEGAYGCVVGCQKRSTGLMYAMKIQPKASLLHAHRRNRDSVMTEFWASTGCPSPFLAQAHYAFQTPKLLFLAMPLYRYGDLRRVLSIQPTGALEHSRAQFIAAELACALMFMHRNGLIHRDLKPDNVFLDDRGHVVLGDLGSVSDEAERLRSIKSEGYVPPSRNGSINNATSKRILPVFAHVSAIENELVMATQSLRSGTTHKSVDNPYPSFSHNHNNNNHNSHGSSFNPFSYNEDTIENETKSHISYAFETKANEAAVGTLNYMSPEAMSLFAGKEGRERVKGCTPALDWFSYGVVVHEMLTGRFPFIPLPGMTYSKLRQVYPGYLKAAKYDVCVAHTCIVGCFSPNPTDLSMLGPHGYSFVSELLQLDAEERLGLNKNCDTAVGGTGSYMAASALSASGFIIMGDVYSELKSSAFFDGIDWDLAVDRRLTPTPMAEVPYSFNTAKRYTCAKALERAKRSLWIDATLAGDLNGAAAAGAEGAGAAAAGGGPDHGTAAVAAANGSGAAAATSSRASNFSLVISDDLQEHFKNWHYAKPEVVEAERSSCHNSSHTTTPTTKKESTFINMFKKQQ